MTNVDVLQTFLQSFLSNDTSAVTFLPSIISSLSSCDLDSSPHLSKWLNRVNSLIHSKDPGVRWAGLCLALRTAQGAKSGTVSFGQGWVTMVLPLLSKVECCAVYKAATRLLSFIFTSTVNLPDFQRQVVIPNVPKFSNALLSLIEKQSDKEMKILCLDALSTLVTTFPTLHRPLLPRLSTCSLNLLNGSPIIPTPLSIAQRASRLHACLHTTAGKVGGSALWRKSIDDTIAFCSAALAALRTGPATTDQFHDDPMAFVAVNLDRLTCGTKLLCALLRTTVSRPVVVPLRTLVALCIDYLKIPSSSLSVANVDESLPVLLPSFAPRVQEFGCQLLTQLAQCTGKLLSPELPRVLSVITSQLEKLSPLSHRLPFVQVLPILLGSCLPSSDPLLAGRLIKAILPHLANLLSQKPSVDNTAANVKGNKKARKRVQDYEGDEIFQSGTITICSSTEDGEVILHSLDALQQLLRTPDLPAYLSSLSARVILSLLIVLPTLSSSVVSSDPSLHARISSKVMDMSVQLSSSSSNILGNSLPLVLRAADSSNNQGIEKILDLMLHPRLPPLLRPLHQLNEVALTSTDESTEERKTREALGLTDAFAQQSTQVNDVDATRSKLLLHNDSRTLTSESHTSLSNEIATTMNLTTSSMDTIDTNIVVTLQQQTSTQPLPIGISNAESPKSGDVDDSLMETVPSSAATLASDSAANSSSREQDQTPRPLLPLQEPVKTSAPRPTDLRTKDRMNVDEEDEEDDIVIPPLTADSDTDDEDD